MPDTGDLLTLIKKSAVEAVEAAKPAAVVNGTVLGTSPLKIRLNQKLVLTGQQLVLLKGAAKLKKGDVCLLLRQQGGQVYVVLGVMG